MLVKTFDILQSSDELVVFASVSQTPAPAATVVLQCLTRCPDVFAGGISICGVSDIAQSEYIRQETMRNSNFKTVVLNVEGNMFKHGDIVKKALLGGEKWWTKTWLGIESRRKSGLGDR
ncbi:hypothetical protein GE21DRAFT_1016563, partial [Neurospora crassa]